MLAQRKIVAGKLSVWRYENFPYGGFDHLDFDFWVLKSSDWNVARKLNICAKNFTKTRLYFSTNQNERNEQTIGVGAQSTLGGQDIFARKICIKNYQNAAFYTIHARIIKIPEFYDICPKN